MHGMDTAWLTAFINPTPSAQMVQSDNIGGPTALLSMKHRRFIGAHQPVWFKLRQTERRG